MSCWLKNNVVKRVDDQNVFQVVEVWVEEVFIHVLNNNYIFAVTKALLVFFNKESQRNLRQMCEDCIKVQISKRVNLLDFFCSGIQFN